MAVKATDIQATIMSLITTGGKKLPEPPFLGMDAQQFVLDIIKAWEDIFADVELHLWQRASRIALTLTSIPDSNLNLNMVTPALMEHALKLARKEWQERQLANHEGEKKEPIINQSTPQETIYLFRFTRRCAFDPKHHITDYYPSAEMIMDQGRALGMETADIRKHSAVIKAYLTEFSYLNAQNKQIRYHLEWNGKELLPKLD